MESVAEEWRAIEGMEGYEVSNLGSVRSIDRVKTNCLGHVHRLKGRVLRLGNHSAGYLSVTFYGRISALAHRIVAAAFIGPCPDGHDVNHIDGNKKNNVASNLEYVTRRENMEHAQRTGLWDNKGEFNGQAKATAEQIKVACALISGGMSQKEAAARVGVTSAVVSNARLGRKWKHLNIRGTKLKTSLALKESLKQEVARLGRLGIPQQEIQRRTGVSKGSLYRILRSLQAAG